MARTATPPLTLDVVLEGGRAIVAREGFEALTMRRIAEQLGVWPTAVYHYVDDRAHLAELVADAIVGQVALPEADDPLEWLRQMSWAVRAVGLAHPGLAAYLLENGAAGAQGMGFVEAAAARLAQLGYGGGALGQTYNWYFTWLAGEVHKTDRYLARGGRAGVSRFMEGLYAVDGDSSPHIAVMRREFNAMPDDPDAVFAWGLEAMLTAVSRAGGEQN